MSFELYLAALLLWAGVGVVLMGAAYEREGRWDGAYLAWPFVALALIVCGVGWTLAWTGRLPVRLFVKWINKPRIPRARVSR